MRALFNGCSFVWGDELIDPMSTRFSRLVCNQTGMEEYNISLRGASNSRIYRTTLDWIQLNGNPDVLIVVWSGQDRIEYIDLNEKDRHDTYYLQCSPSRLHAKEFQRKKRHLSAYMSEILNDYKCSIDIINYMCSIQHICEISNIKLLQFQFTSGHRKMKTAISNTEPRSGREAAFLDYYKSKLNYLKEYSTYGLNDDHDLLTMSKNISDVMFGENFYGHPLEDSQVLFKDMMIKELEEHYDIRFQ